MIVGTITGLMVPLVFVGLWLAASLWAKEARFGIMHWLQEGLGIPLWAHAMGAVVLLDFWTYAWHRLNHEVPFFWRFHYHYLSPEKPA